MHILICPNCHATAKGTAQTHCHHCPWLKCTRCQATWDTNTGVWMIEGQAWGTPNTKLSAG